MQLLCRCNGGSRRIIITDPGAKKPKIFHTHGHLFLSEILLLPVLVLPRNHRENTKQQSDREITNLYKTCADAMFPFIGGADK